MRTTKALLGLGLAVLMAASVVGQVHGERRAVRFVGGFETDPRDGGRPVVLIASALGAPSEVFREAFSHVRPARGGEPEPTQVQRNKQALLGALGRYGITNDVLDEVSNYYRYRADRGETWRHSAATAYATVVGGKVVGFTITNTGAGYSSAPDVEVEGIGAVDANLNLAFTRRFETNGSISSITLGTGTTRRSAFKASPAGIDEALRREAIPREVVGRLDLTPEQERRLVAVAFSSNDRRTLHESALAVLTPSQRELVEQR